MTFQSNFSLDIFQKDEIFLEKGKSYIISEEFYIKDSLEDDLIIIADGSSIYEIHGLIDSERFSNTNQIYQFLNCEISSLLDSSIENLIGGDKLPVEEAIEKIVIMLNDDILELNIDYSITPQFTNIYGNFVDRLVFSAKPDVGDIIRIKENLSFDFDVSGGIFTVPQKTKTGSFFFTNKDDSQTQKIKLISPDLNESNNTIDQIFPPWIKGEYPLFYQFVHDYFDFGNRIFEPKEILKNSQRYRDIDKVPEEFLQNYANEYLQKLSGNNLVDQRLLIKHISDFFAVKGRENSFNFLMKTSYGSKADIYIPKNKLIQSSGGKWEVTNIMRVISPEIGSVVYPNDITVSIGTTNEELLTLDSTKIRGVISRAEAIVESTKTLTLDGVEFIELNLSNIDGIFLPFEKIEVVESDTNKTIFGFVLPCVIGLKSNVIDVDWLANATDDFEDDYILANPTLSEDQRIQYLKRLEKRIFSVTSSSGTGCELILKSVNPKFIEIFVHNQGIGFVDGDSFDLSETLSFSVDIGTVLKRTKRKNSHGSLSSGHFIQDGIYHQRHSYEIGTNISMKEWKQTFKDIIHPRGLAMFGSNSSIDILEIPHSITLD